MNNTREPLGFLPVFALALFATGMGVTGVVGGIRPEFIYAALPLLLAQSLALLLLLLAFRRGGYGDAFELLCASFSRPGARILLLLLGVYFAFRSAEILRSQSDCVSFYLLESTPPAVILAMLLITAFFAAFKGLRQLSGNVSLLLFFVLPLFVVIVVVALVRCDFGELRVVLQPSADYVGESVPHALAVVSGAESALFFLGLSKTKKDSGRAAVFSVAASAVLLTAMMLASVGTIGASGVCLERYPFIEAARQINIGGIALTERFDMPMLVVTLFVSIGRAAIFLFCGATAISAAFGTEKRSVVCLAMVPFVYALALAAGISSVGRVMDRVAYIGFFVIILLIFPVAAITSIFNGKKEKAS